MSPTVQAHGLDLIALRRELHQIPEVGLQLPRTHARLLAEFEHLPVEITEAAGASGFVAVLRGTASDPADGRRPIVLLRADMDALPVAEETGGPFASTNGSMHACGHDLHMAAIVGAARSLCARRKELHGDVVFLLQAGEEGHGEARLVLEEGLIEAAGRRPDHAYGLHVWSSGHPTGSIRSRAGALMAGVDTFDVRVIGRGGHGSAPQHTVDPIPILCEMVTQSQVMITRQFDIFDPVVLTCGVLRAGEANNVIPDQAMASFSMRTFSHATRQKALEQLTRLFRHLAQARGAHCELEVTASSPTTCNEPAEVDYVEAIVQRGFPGRWSPMADPVTASEDFAYVLEQIPGAFVFVSAVPEGTDSTTASSNHSPQAIFDDSVLDDAARLLAELALGRLAGSS